MTLRRIDALVDEIADVDVTAMDAARARQATLTKPAGSLGRLEELAVQIAGMRGAAVPSVARKAVIVMAGDHGIAAQGVSAYPAEVTAQMVANYARGGAAVNVIARTLGARVVVVDIGVRVPIVDDALVRSRRIAAGTADFSLAPAMSREDAERAIDAGVGIVDEEAARGLDLVATGDMGIGNTTSASALAAVMCERRVREVTGRGTGIGDDAYRRKVTLIERALDRHRPSATDPLGVLASVGGFEIAGLVGVILAAAARRIPVVLDGFITGSAALIAVAVAPRARSYLIAAHRSVEPGHRVMLDRLGLRPLLDLDLRLGEGSGAALAFAVIDAAVRAHADMATFASAGVSGPA